MKLSTSPPSALSKGQPSVVRRRILTLLALAAALCHAPAQTPAPPPARTSAATATIIGRVLDPTGAIVPGAKIQLQRADGAIAAAATTDSAGRFQLPQPSPGDYHLTVALPGFTPLDHPLHIARTPLAPLTLTLDLANVVTSVTVNADRDTVAAEPENNHDSAAVSADDMKLLPIFDADIVSTLSAFLDTGAAGEGGVTLVVDGNESRSVGVAPSAIERISTNQDPYSAQYRQPGRGQVEVITKSAAERFHGSASFTFRDSALNATNYFATTKPPEQRRIYEGFLSGPVRPLPNSGFLFTLTRREEDSSAQVLATTLPTVLPEQNVPVATRSTELTMKLSHQYNDHHSAYLLYYFDDSSATNQNVGGLTQASTGYAAYQFDQEFTYHDDLTFAANKLNQLNVKYERNLDRNVSNQQAQQIIVEGVGEFGGAQNDSYNTENNPDVTDMVSWTLAKPAPQQIKFGLQITNTGRRILDDFTDRQGTYTFSSAAAYAAGTPASFSRQQGQDRFFTLYSTPSAFIYDEIQATKRLTVSPGARFDFQTTISNTKDGVEPRLSIAYLVDKKHALVLRTGAGLFIRRMGANIVQDLARDQSAAEPKLLLPSGSGYPACTAAQLAAPPPSLSDFEPSVHAPMQAYFSLSIERQLTKNSTVTLAYNGYRGWHALRAIDINAPPPPFTSYARPNPNYSQILQLQSEGYQKTDGMTFNYRGRIRKAFSGNLQYTWQHADANTLWSYFTPQNMYNPNDEWSRTDWDQRQRLALFGTFYPDKPLTLGVGFYANTPMPYTETTGTDDYHTGLFNARPAGVPRNSLNGGAYQDVDLRLNYTRKLHPKLKDDPAAVEFSLSSFNTLNRVNFDGYNGVVNSPTFKQPTYANDPRKLQLSASYTF